MAASVASGAIRPRTALLLAAICDFFGCLLSCSLFPAVTETILDLADFDEIRALSAAMLSVILWGVVCWYYGIASSESHALISALTGAALVYGKSHAHLEQWLLIFSGIFVPCAISVFSGAILAKQLRRFPENSHLFSKLCVFAAAFSSFMHGAQDGQKFFGVLVLILSASCGKSASYFGFIVLISCVLALGAATAGTRILHSVGAIADLDARRGFCADASSVFGTLIATIFGLPASTTHTQAMAIIGSASEKCVDLHAIRGMTLAWVLTFPGCGALGYILTSVFMRI